MILELEIPDSVYKKYQKHSKNPEKAILGNISKFSEVSLEDRVLVVKNQERQELETILGTYLENPRALVDYLREALKLRLDGAEIEPTPDILGLLKSQADFEGVDYKDYLKTKLAESVNIAVQGFA